MRAERWRDGVVPTLLCARCERWLSPGDFPVNPRMRHGRGSWCKPCQAASNRRWRAATPEYQAAYNADRRAAYASAKGPGGVRAYSTRQSSLTPAATRTPTKEIR